MILEQKWNFLFLALLVVGAVVVSMVYKSDRNEPACPVSDPNVDWNIVEIAKNYEKEFYCENTSNVGQTECLIENLDRASAVREWKQKKLEILKHPEINTYNLVPVLSDEIDKIKRWRNNFENSRDEGCIAKYVFRGGSGLPGLIARCELDYEISALRTLDWIYYETIKGNHNSYNQGISNFEPTEEDIEKIMLSNKTERGCVWADDEACE